MYDNEAENFGWVIEYENPAAAIGQNLFYSSEYPQASLRPELLVSYQDQTTPAPHAGLGLPGYVQATSPMRRYLDLAIHQQLRAFLSGSPLLDAADLIERGICRDMTSTQSFTCIARITVTAR